MTPYWWMDPQVQRDRESFMRAVAERVPEWTARKAEIDACKRWSGGQGRSPRSAATVGA